MGIAIPQVVTEDRASSAQVIGGSLKFDQTRKTHLTRTPSSAGNRKVWTLSYWIKFNGSMGGHLFAANNDAFQLEYRSDNFLLFANSGSTSGNTTSTQVFRDFSGFYHVMIHHDAANLAADVYINGRLSFTATLSDANGTWNNNTSHNINGRSTSHDSYNSFAMSQDTFIDGLRLGPSYFAYTDPLTGTWRPKKFKAEGTTVNDGTVWSNASMSGAGTVNNKTNAFDGSISSVTGSTGANTNLTFTFTKSIPVKNSVRVYHNQSGTIKINNETAVSTSSGGANWVTLFKGQTNFTSLTLTSTGGDTCGLSSATEPPKFFGVQLFPFPDWSSPIGEFPSIGR